MLSSASVRKIFRQFFTIMVRLSKEESYTTAVTVENLFDRRRLAQVLYHKFTHLYKTNFLKLVADAERKIKIEKVDEKVRH